MIQNIQLYANIQIHFWLNAKPNVTTIIWKWHFSSELQSYHHYHCALAFHVTHATLHSAARWYKWLHYTAEITALSQRCWQDASRAVWPSISATGKIPQPKIKQVQRPGNINTGYRNRKQDSTDSMEIRRWNSPPRNRGSIPSIGKEFIFEPKHAYHLQGPPNHHTMGTNQGLPTPGNEFDVILTVHRR